MTAAEREAIIDAIEAAYPTYRTTAGIPARREVIQANIDGVLRAWRVSSEAEED